MPGVGQEETHAPQQGKTFISRIERGFDFLGCHFSPTGMKIAAKTIAGFFAKPTKRDVFILVVELQAAISRFVVEHNAEPNPSHALPVPTKSSALSDVFAPSVRFDPLAFGQDRRPGFRGLRLRARPESLVDRLRSAISETGAAFQMAASGTNERSLFIRYICHIRAFPEKAESGDSHRVADMIQASCW
jgi:hypothetical protein